LSKVSIQTILNAESSFSFGGVHIDEQVDQAFGSFLETVNKERVTSIPHSIETLDIDIVFDFNLSPKGRKCAQIKCRVVCAPIDISCVSMSPDSHKVVSPIVSIMLEVDVDQPRKLEVLLSL
jgi:hypothetical protein